MTKTRLLVVALMSLALALPAFGKSHKSSYSFPCSQVWSAVKDTLGNAENYGKVELNETTMTAAYHVKHNVHISAGGAILQRTNHVALETNGAACEMKIGSNYSGIEHNDADDFKKRVDEARAKMKGTPPSEPAKTEAPAK